MRAIWRAVWCEPRPAGPPPVGRRDHVLAAGFAAVALVEGLARPDLAWQPWATVLAVALMPTLLWRRSHPLATCLIGFGLAGLLSIVQLRTGGADLGLSAMMVILLFLYALVRWGSGREIVIGMPFVGVVVALGMYVAAASWADAVGGVLFVLLFVALAAVFRSRADLWARQQRDIRNEERLSLARELHDTVAHHVSAIAVQAQAGGVVAASAPQQTALILAAIEAEATSTLAEMRAMVRMLRDDGPDPQAPRVGVADLAALGSAKVHPRVEVSLTGPLGTLPTSVDGAIYRLAQEALTNAVRHARGATRVEIEVRRVAGDVTLRVTDDGRTDPGRRTAPGFGLTGMAERAHLLGGSFSAGPSPTGGWIVEATLPAEVRARDGRTREEDGLVRRIDR